MTREELDKPITEVEAASVQDALRPAPELHAIMRRLLWQRDRMKAEIEKLNSQLSGYMH